MAGKLVSTNNGASLFYAMGGRKKHPLFEKNPGHHAGWAGRNVRLRRRLQLGVFQKSKYHELAEDMIRWVEDEKRFEEYMKACSGQESVYSRERPSYWKSDPTTKACCRTSCAACGPAIPARSRPQRSRCRRSTWLCDMAGGSCRRGSRSRRR